MVAPARQRFTFAEYLLVEQAGNVRHEFLEGHVWAMAGGSPEHAAICANVIALLSAAVRDRPCRVFSADLRVRVRATGLATYPDVTVICGQLEVDPDDPKGHTATNPILVVEVLSPSTEAYDRGEKLEHYRQIASLQEIVLVHHESQHVEVWRRVGDAWTPTAYDRGAVELRSVTGTLPIAEIYRNPLG
jgi:Uma2 family endonuclease